MMTKIEQQTYDMYKENALRYEKLYKQQQEKILKLINYLELRIPQEHLLEHQQELKYVKNYLEKY